MLRYLKVKRELLYELDIVFTLSNIGFSGAGGLES